MTDVAMPARRFWPAALVKHERDQSGISDADLEIRPAKQRDPAAQMQHDANAAFLRQKAQPTLRGREDRYSLESLWRTFALPAYWRGAMQTRQALGDTGRGLLLCAQIERDLIAGKGLGAAFREWREGAR